MDIIICLHVVRCEVKIYNLDIIICLDVVRFEVKIYKLNIIICRTLVLNRLACNSGTLGQPLASQLGHSRSGGTTSSCNSVMGFHLAIKLNTKIRNPTLNM